MSKAAELAALIGSQTALSDRNIIINGAMQVAQRGTSVTGLGGSGAYGAVDRFRIAGGSTGGRLTASQVAVTDLPGFTTALKLECTTADTSIAAGENLIIQQKLEGRDVQRLKKGTSSAEPITISFYVKGNAAATYTCEAKDQDNQRYNNQEFSVTTSWNRISLTFVGDTTGSFTNDNNASFELGLWLHAGSTFTSGTFASNTWHTDNGKRVGDNQTSFYDSTSRTFFLTGVQIEIGEQATPFEHRSFGDELVRCQRYYEKNKIGIESSTSVSNALGVAFESKTTKRTTPTVVIEATGSGNKIGTGPYTQSTTLSSTYPTDSGIVGETTNGSATGDFVGTYTVSFSSEL